MTKGRIKRIPVWAALVLALLASGCDRQTTESRSTPDATLRAQYAQYSMITLDLLSIDADSFTGQTPWAYPCTYTVHYALGDGFCVGDRVEVFYSSLTEDEGAHESGRWTATVEAVFVDYSDFELEENVAYKPVIYLYPEQPTEVEVLLDYDGEVTATLPEYGDGWHVTAYPDGTLVDAEGRSYPYLFWEGESDTVYDLSRGFCVSGAETEVFLRETLAALGLNAAETQDFIEFWLPHMDQNAYNRICFQAEAYTDGARLTISPGPDSLLRVFMVFTPLDAPVALEPQSLPAFTREGFCAVEWGGALVSD